MAHFVGKLADRNTWTIFGMTNQLPPDDTEYASFDDVPKRIKQPQWRWWRQLFAVALFCVLIGAVAIMSLLNRPRTVSQQPVTLLADLAAPQGGADPLVVNFGSNALKRSDLNVEASLTGLQAGARVCFQVQSRRLDGTPRFNLIELDRC